MQRNLTTPLRRSGGSLQRLLHSQPRSVAALHLLASCSSRRTCLPLALFPLPCRALSSASRPLHASSAAPSAAASSAAAASASDDLLLSVSMNVHVDREATSQREMCEQLRANGLLKSDRVFDAMCSVDRAHFARLPPGASTMESMPGPYAHAPCPIGQMSTISSPYSHALALQELESSGVLVPGARVLDVGSGSGYVAAALSLLVAPPASDLALAAQSPATVVALEHSSVLLDQSRRNIRQALASSEHMLARGIVRYVQGDANDAHCDWMTQLPRASGGEMRLFDAIHVGAAFEALPRHFLNLLRVGGVMLLPLGPQGSQHLTLVRKLSDSPASDGEGVAYEIRRVMACSYAPIAPQPPPKDADDVAAVQRERDAVASQIEGLKKALQEWQSKFKETHGRRPSAAELKSDATASKLMDDVAPLLKRKTGLERVLARVQAGNATQ